MTAPTPVTLVGDLAAQGRNRPIDRPSLDALGVQLCFSVSYLSEIAPEIVFAQILDECGLPSRDVLADIAVEFGLAVVLDGMPAAASVPALLADIAAPFAVIVSGAAAASRRQVA
jgi:hypothetical protein